MATEAAYDQFAERFAELVGRDAESSPTIEGIARRALLAAAGDVTGLDALDLGCGEGHIMRRLAAANDDVRLTGVDLSARLLDVARERAAAAGLAGRLRYVQGNAHDLAPFADRSFDLVYSNLMLMDVPELGAAYQAVARVLRPGGRFLCTLLHPCFYPPGGDTETDVAGRFAARRVARYTDEGFWRSDGVGTVRGTVGAHHRMVSTYVNGLLDAGFTLRRLAEPSVATAEPAEDVRAQAYAQVPPVLLIEAVR